jgi:hypothetical protein
MFSDLEDFAAFGGAGYDMTRSASNSTSMETVSPVELLMSAPGSTAFTNLTSPSIYTPELDSYDASPNFEALDFDSNPENWTSLFPDSGNAAPTYLADQSPAVDDLELRTTGQQQRKSSTATSPKSSHRQSGVGSRKRELPPILVEDPNDTVAVKRARNTLAARKSRERKAKKMEEYEEIIERLTKERDMWKAEALARGASE